MRQRAVIYSLKAADDLDWIYDTIAGAGSAITADGYDQRIRAFCERLDYGSERGALRDDLRPGLRIIGFERRVTVALYGGTAPGGDIARVLRRRQLGGRVITCGGKSRRPIAV